MNKVHSWAKDPEVTIHTELNNWNVRTPDEKKQEPYFLFITVDLHLETQNTSVAVEEFNLDNLEEKWKTFQMPKTLLEAAKLVMEHQLEVKAERGDIPYLPVIYRQTMGKNPADIDRIRYPMYFYFPVRQYEGTEPVFDPKTLGYASTSQQTKRRRERDEVVMVLEKRINELKERVLKENKIPIN